MVRLSALSVVLLVLALASSTRGKAIRSAVLEDSAEVENSDWAMQWRMLEATTTEIIEDKGFCKNDINDSQTCSTDGDEWQGVYVDHCRIIPVSDNTTNYATINSVLSKTASSLSFIGGVFTLVTYCVSPLVRNQQILVEVQLAVTCLISNTKSFFVGLYDVYSVDTCCPTVACAIEAAVDNFAGMSAVLWSGCITVQAYLLIVLVMTPKSMAHVYKFFYIVGYGVPLAMTIWPMLAGYFGPAGGFCWIPSSRVWQQVVFYYMWLFLVDATIIGLLIHIGFAVRGTKATGVINRFIAYAVWAVFATFGFMVMRSREWANPCTDSPFALTAWNSVFFPAQGLGYSIIFAMNRNVHRGWKEAMTCKKQTSLATADESAKFGTMEMSEVSLKPVTDAEVVAKMEADGYSDDDSD